MVPCGQRARALARPGGRRQSGLAPLPWREGARLPGVNALDYVPGGWRAEIPEVPERNEGAGAPSLVRNEALC